MIAAEIGKAERENSFESAMPGSNLSSVPSRRDALKLMTRLMANPCHVHDYHATILQLMGIDHTRLTYRYAGRTSG